MEYSNSCPIDYSMNNFKAGNALDSIYPNIDSRRECHYPSEYHYSREMPQVPDAPSFDSHFQSSSDIEREQTLLHFDNIFYPHFYRPEIFQEKNSQNFFHDVSNVDKYCLPPDESEKRLLHPFTKNTTASPEVENLSVYFEESRQLWQNILQNHFNLHPEEGKSNFESEKKLGNFATVQNEYQITAEEKTMVDQGNIYSSENENLRRGLTSTSTAVKRKVPHIEYSQNDEICSSDNSMEESFPPSKILRSERPLERGGRCDSPRLSIDEKVLIPDVSTDLRKIYLQISFDKQCSPLESNMDRKECPSFNREGGNISSPPISTKEKSNFHDLPNGRKFSPKILFDERYLPSKAPSYENNQNYPEREFSSGSPINHFRNSFSNSDAFNKDSFYEQRSCPPYEISSSQDLKSHGCNGFHKVKNFDSVRLSKSIHDHHFRDSVASTSCCHGPKTCYAKPHQEWFSRKFCHGRFRHYCGHQDNRRVNLETRTSINNLNDEPVDALTEHNSQRKFHEICSQSEANEMQCCDRTEKHFNVPTLTKSCVDQKTIYVRSKEDINDAFIPCPNIKLNGRIKMVHNDSEEELTKSDIKSRERLSDIRQNNSEECELKNKSCNNSGTLLNKLDIISLDHSYCKLSEPLEIILD